MTSLATYLWCIYSLLFINSNAQSVSTNLCLWGCRDATTCMNMNGVFYAIPTSTELVNGKQYYKQDDRGFDQCTQVYYIYWRSDLGSLGWYIGFGDGVSFEFGSTNIIGRCLDRTNQLAGGGYNFNYPGTCTIWEFFNGNTGNWEVNSDMTVIEGDCPSLECATVNVDVPSSVFVDSRYYGCETAELSSTLDQIQPYPNMFWSDRGSNLPANLVFNYKAWRWACYGDSVYNVNNGEGDVLPRCGGQAAGVTAYSTLDQDFNGLTDGESMTVNMDLFDGLDFDTNADVVISCVGEPTISITLSPTTAVPTGSVTIVYNTLSPVTQSPTVLGQTRTPTEAVPTVATTRFPTPPTIDCDKYDCSGGDGSGSGNDGDSCASFAKLCWWWWLLIILLIICVCCILCILLYKCCQKRKENEARETEMFGKDDTGSGGNAGGGSYQPNDNYGGNQYNNNTDNTVPPPPSNNSQPQYNQNQNYGNNNQGWGGNQNYNQNQNYGNNQYGNNQYGNNNQGGWGGNQTYTQD